MSGRCAATMRALRRGQDRRTGDFGRFWRARDYVSHAGGVRASVFLAHGLNDLNVRTKAFSDWWAGLERTGVARKLWLHRGGHGPPASSGARAFERERNRWFDAELLGVANGIHDEPAVTLQREDGAYTREAAWPAPGAQPAVLALSADSAQAPGALTSAPAAVDVRQGFTDRGRTIDTDRVLIREPDVANPNRLVYRSPVLAADVRLSGTPRVELALSIDNRTAANLTAVLVDYSAERAAMVTRGWLDPRNRDGEARSRPVRRGLEYALGWDLQPDDHVFRAGHRIGLVVVSTDHDYTLRPRPGTRLSLAPARSRLELPVLGGPAALGF